MGIPPIAVHTIEADNPPMLLPRHVMFALMGLLLLSPGCGGDGDVDGDWWQPGVNTSWQWQLTHDGGGFNLAYDVDAYDVDLFDVTDAELDALKSDGRRVICYFSAGSFEEWRDDADTFPASVLGDPLDGWAGERWLDVRDPSVLEIMETRITLANARGCDGVEPDNVDGYQNDTGFPLTEADQLAYLEALSGLAHERGLAIGLKNSLGIVPDLVHRFDFSVNEECHAYDECDLLAPFIDAGKPVFNAEYTEADTAQAAATLADQICADALARQFRTLVLPWDLNDAFRVSCDDG